MKEIKHPWEAKKIWKVWPTKYNFPEKYPDYNGHGTPYGKITKASLYHTIWKYEPEIALLKAIYDSVVPITIINLARILGIEPGNTIFHKKLKKLIKEGKIKIREKDGQKTYHIPCRPASTPVKRKKRYDLRTVA